MRSGCPAGQFVYVDVLASDQLKDVAFGCIWQDKVVHFCENKGSQYMQQKYNSNATVWAVIINMWQDLPW